MNRRAFLTGSTAAAAATLAPLPSKAFALIPPNPFMQRLRFPVKDFGVTTLRLSDIETLRDIRRHAALLQELYGTADSPLCSVMPKRVRAK